MAIIDLTINKPALKRTEIVTSDADTTATDEPSTEDGPPEDTAESPVTSGSRLRRAAGITGALAVSVVGLLTFRKLRGRRKKAQTDEEAAE
jgi:hypothetical protein